MPQGIFCEVLFENYLYGGGLLVVLEGICLKFTKFNECAMQRKFGGIPGIMRGILHDSNEGEANQELSRILRNGMNPQIEKLFDENSSRTADYTKDRGSHDSRSKQKKEEDKKKYIQENIIPVYGALGIDASKEFLQ